MKLKRILILLVVILTISAIGYVFFSNLGRNKFASLDVDSNLKTDVFVDGKKVGTTRYTGSFKPGEVVLRINDFETRVTLLQAIRTVVRRNFDETTKKSYGEILSFEKTDLSGAGIAVITSPKSAKISIDGRYFGTSPIDIDGLIAGRHTLLVSMDGFKSEEFLINSIEGYKLTAQVDLLSQTQEESQPTSSVVEKVIVKILTTPNGFLRVRSEPSTTSSEVGRVHDGESYELISKDTKTGWFQIKLSQTVFGWISNTYASTKN